MSYTVAIVGRPNVGKSTLFNRLCGRRLALVDPTPGLTRDRREVEADIAGVPVRLVDTAGFEPAEPGATTERMLKQTGLAIAGADLVLFMIDARAGLSGPDRAFAEVTRRGGRPVLLVANKCEGRAGTGGYYEAFELGLGEPVAISAEHGEGISDLMSEIVGHLGVADDEVAGAEKGSDEDVAERAVKIAIVGRPNVGKSTLANALIGDERMLTGPEAGLTRDTIATDIVHAGRRVRLYDTAGLRRKARIEARAEQLAVADTLRAIRFAEVVVLLADAERGIEKQDLTIADLAAEEGRAVVIAVNKWDLVDDKKKALADIRDEVERSLPQLKDVPIVPLSARSGKGVGRVLEAAFAVYDTWNRRVPTPALNRWLIEATERHAPPAASGRRIKLRFMTQPSTRPPTFVVFCSKPDALPASYLRYLVNGLRQAFEMPAVPIRMQLRKGDNPYAGRRGTRASRQ